MEQILRCHCGKPYRVYGNYCGDQSLCPGCRMALEAEVQRWEQSGYSAPALPPGTPLRNRRDYPHRRQDFMTLMKV